MLMPADLPVRNTLPCTCDCHESAGGYATSVWAVVNEVGNEWLCTDCLLTRMSSGEKLLIQLLPTT